MSEASAEQKNEKLKRLLKTIEEGIHECRAILKGEGHE